MDKFQKIKAKLEEISLLVDSLDKQKDNSAEWSEEDEKYVELIKKGIEIWAFYEPYTEAEIYDWLDSLKDKYSTQPPQEWSKEDKMRIHEIIETLNIVQDNRLRTQRMHYSKATIDNDIKWLKSLKGKVVPQPRHKWSEKDSLILDSIISVVEEWEDNRSEKEKEYYGKSTKSDWLKFLKDRVQSQPKPAWSEEDETNASYICAALDCYNRLREERNNTNGQEDLDKARYWLYNKLKSLRPQNTWKPSDVQLHYLSWIANIKLGDSVVEQEVSKHLNELLEDLEKLKEK